MSQTPGLNLADIAPMYEDIPIGDSFLRVHGISAKAGLSIFQRYPRILGMMVDGFNLGTFLSAAPDAVAAIIASASGHPNDEAAELAASDLVIETQTDILEAIGRLTFTKGFAPFVTRIMALADVASSASYSKVPDMTSPLPSAPLSQTITPQA
jgi:hypothetical protein